MWGQIFFGGLVKGWNTTTSGCLTKFVQTAYITKYQNYFYNTFNELDIFFREIKLISILDIDNPDGLVFVNNRYGKK